MAESFAKILDDIKVVADDFIVEEDGMGVIEVVVIIAVLLGVALIFRKQLSEFALNLMKSIFGDTDKYNAPMEGQ